jgi:uncharacterized protein
MRRRVFVGGAFAGAVSASGGRSTPTRIPDIPQRVFGKTGQKVTIVGLAGGRLYLTSVEQARAVVRRAVELGVTYFDNARNYGDGVAEETFGAVLPPHRQRIFLTSKSVERTRQGAEADLHRSLKALRTDYLDLWQIHGVAETKDVEAVFAPGGAIEAFEAARQSGKCRFIGFTGHQDPAVHLEMLRRYNRYDSIFMPLHVADPHFLSFEKQVLPVAVSRSLGIQAMKTTANSKLLQGFSVQDCLRYVLSLPVHCASMGANTPAQIEDDVRIACEFTPLSAAQMEELRQRSAALKGPALEDWKRDPSRASIDRRSPYHGG